MIKKVASADWAGARGEKWREHIHGLEAMIGPVDEPLIDALALDAPARVADVGCGGGGVALGLWRRAPAGSFVCGYDISPSLIEAARGRVPQGSEAIGFEVADMASAAPPERLYDRLVSRFGVMFFDDPPGAFKNLARWLAPGGRLAFGVWGELGANPWLSVVSEVVDSIVRAPAPPPDSPGPLRYADPRALVQLLEQAGFGGLQTREWRGLLPVGGGKPAAEAAAFALASLSLAEVLKEAGVDAQRAAHEALAGRLARYERGGAVWVPACVHIVTGERR